MSARKRTILALSLCLSACAEPTGTESGNPSMPGAHSPVPNLPPPLPPPNPMPLQPGPTVQPSTDPEDNVVTDVTEVGSDPSSTTAVGADSTTLSPMTPPMMPPMMPPPVVGTTGEHSVDGNEQTPPSPTAGPEVETAETPGSDFADAGDAGGLDAGQ